MGVRGKCLQLGQMRQVDLAAAQNPMSPPFFGVQFLDNYGLIVGGTPAGGRSMPAT
jgi:hypothetical protein